MTFYRSSTRRHTADTEFDVSRIQSLPKVEILYSYVGADPENIRAIVSNGAQGVVFAGTGAGGLSTAERAVVKGLLALPPHAHPVMVRSSRVGNGRVIANAENDAVGLIPADTLNPAKARILLMLALTVTKDPQQIRRMFGEY